VAAVGASGGSWSVRLAGGETIRAGAILVACPGEDAARALAAHDSALAGGLRRLRYASCATVNVVYEKDDVRARLEGNGFFVPRAERLPILACSYVTEKFEGRAPAGMAVFRAFLGGAMNPDALDADDAGLVRTTHECLRRILDIHGGPVFGRVHRAPAAMPQFDVGARELIGGIRSLADRHPGLFLAGSVAGAFGLPDCIRSGEEAAERAAAFAASQSASSEWVAYQANQNA
jgi:oxygen-dependent protoporphyrinogen oxidase